MMCCYRCIWLLRVLEKDSCLSLKYPRTAEEWLLRTEYYFSLQEFRHAPAHAVAHFLCDGLKLTQNISTTHLKTRSCCLVSGHYWRPQRVQIQMSCPPSVSDAELSLVLFAWSITQHGSHYISLLPPTPFPPSIFAATESQVFSFLSLFSCKLFFPW